MKTIILCGGRGTRMKEETEFKPKSLVEIGGKPILWHIMKIYSHYGFNEFILALGYKGDMIKDYFLKAKHFLNDFTLDMTNHSVELHSKNHEDLKITFADTGMETLTGGRILKLKKYLGEDENFMLTYGDGVANINLKNLVDFHERQNTIATLTGVRPHSRFGMLKVDDARGIASHFQQKPVLDDYISGGFMVFKRQALDYMDEGWVENAFSKLAIEGQLSVFKHDGFWQPMDTYQEMEELNRLWHAERPWAVWER